MQVGSVPRNSYAEVYKQIIPGGITFLEFKVLLATASSDGVSLNSGEAEEFLKHGKKAEEFKIKKFFDSAKDMVYPSTQMLTGSDKRLPLFTVAFYMWEKMGLKIRDAERCMDAHVKLFEESFKPD